MIRKVMNGQLNRLSDQTKDGIIRTIKNIFDNNSISIANHVLKDCILAACGNQTQIMTSLIPIYASIIAALHFSVGLDVGAFIIENLTIQLHAAMHKRLNTSENNDIHSHISNKLSSNILLLLVYLYNLRVLHHNLIMDILLSLVEGDKSTSTSTDTIKYANDKSIGEMEAELLVCVIEHCK